MKEFEYMGDTIAIRTRQVGMRWSWSYETHSGLSEECKEAGNQTEEAAFIEAEHAARHAIDRKRKG